MTFHNLKTITVILQNIELIPQLHYISVTYVILECPLTITTDTKLKNDKNIFKTSSHVTAIGRHCSDRQTWSGKCKYVKIAAM